MVEEILFHHGMQGDTIFEIKWKTGNITWLPSHEVSHLRAFKNYLDVQGIEQITAKFKMIGHSENAHIGRL
jgi:hypothetical protein